jgi:hypothetical protein
VDVKTNQTINAFYPPIQQVLVIHDLGYVSREHHGDYVSKINMGIKQDHMPSKPNQVGILPPKEIIHESILWSNASTDENVTIDSIVNAMTLATAVFHILQ